MVEDATRDTGEIAQVAASEHARRLGRDAENPYAADPIGLRVVRPGHASGGRARRGDAGRCASSARARNYALDLMPILDAIAGDVGRTPQSLAPELTRRGVCKPRGGAVWTHVDVGRLLYRIETVRAR